MKKTDLIVIGAGPGGYRAAAHAARLGLHVTLFESGEVGGTCLNRGCIPTKTYVYAPTLAEAFARQQQVVAQLRGGVEQLLSHPNITLVRSRAEFVDAHTVGSAASGEVSAPAIIVATGSSAKLLPVPDLDDPRLVTSTELLQLQSVPRRLCIVGAGVIGMEFASVFRRFGSEVTVVEYLKECLPSLDSDIAKRLRKLLEKPVATEAGGAALPGIRFQLKTAVERLSALEGDTILMATGRRPNVSADFARAGFAYDARAGIATDEHFQTTVAGIYAIGDVNGRQLLAHAAEMQALHVVNRLAGRADNIRFDIMPAAIFTTPEAASVGLSEDQCKQQGQPYECRKAFHRANGKALAMGQTEGMLKLLSQPDSGRIVGCHAFGAQAAAMVQEVSALMCRDTTVSQLRDMVHIHPTLSEILLAAAES